VKFPNTGKFFGCGGFLNGSIMAADIFSLERRHAFLPAVLRIRDVYPGSRIQKEQQKRGVKKDLLSYLFCSHKFHKIENYFIFEMLKKKNLGQFSKNYRTFYPKIVTKLSKIWVWDPGSGKTYSGSRIRAQGPKRHLVPDPDPQHRNVCGRMIEERGRDQAAQVQKILAGGQHLQQVSSPHHTLRYQE
jgi:hypothetical protein